MKVLLDILKYVVGHFLLIVLVGAALILLSWILGQPSLSAEKEIFLAIRDSCGDEIIQATRIMQARVPEGAQESSIFGLYYLYSMPETWDPQAYVLLMKAHAKVGQIFDDLRPDQDIHYHFRLRRLPSVDAWYMELQTDLHKDFEAVYMIYFDGSDSGWDPLGDQPGWYYDTLRRQ